jgi:hypothetical protein
MFSFTSSSGSVESLRLNHFLGEGGYGLVYCGTWRRDTVAVKVRMVEWVCGSYDNGVKMRMVVWVFGSYEDGVSGPARKGP